MNSTNTNTESSVEIALADVRELFEIEAVLVGGGDVSGVGY
jgi:hypothetical protein